MTKVYNIYCDESCHLENDGQKSMVLGAISCPEEDRHEAFKRIREIKVKHGLASDFEIKWTKISPAKEDFYIDVINYFFDSDDLSFRGLVIQDKSLLDHHSFTQTHDEWYYKMYFSMLKTILNPQDKYQIYIDIKDTIGGKKVRKLEESLSNNMYDFSRKIIKRIQIVESHEIELMQMTDLFIGALSYFHRGLTTNNGKIAIIKKIKERSGYSLEKSTLLKEKKLNLLMWEPSNA